MGNYPSMGSKGGTVVGALELNLCLTCPGCGGCGAWNPACCPCMPGACDKCCPGLKAPAGPEWDAVKDEFAPLLEEVGGPADPSAPDSTHTQTASD